MPQTPVPEFKEFPKLKKLAGELDDRTDLYIRGKKIEERLKAINGPLFKAIRAALPEDVKSFQYEYDEEHYLIVPMQSKARESFKREKLLNKVFKCPHCKEGITVPVRVVDSAYELGKQPKPTVSVKLLGEDENNNNEE